MPSVVIPAVWLPPAATQVHEPAQCATTLVIPASPEVPFLPAITLAAAGRSGSGGEASTRPVTGPPVLYVGVGGVGHAASNSAAAMSGGEREQVGGEQ